MLYYLLKCESASQEGLAFSSLWVTFFGLQPHDNVVHCTFKNILKTSFRYKAKLSTKYRPYTPSLTHATSSPIGIPHQSYLSAISVVLSFLGCHILGIIQYAAFSDWLLALSNRHSSFLHIFLWLDCLTFCS